MRRASTWIYMSRTRNYVFADPNLLLPHHRSAGRQD
jgi:hypothetical protein